MPLAPGLHVRLAPDFEWLVQHREQPGPAPRPVPRQAGRAKAGLDRGAPLVCSGPFFGVRLGVVEVPDQRDHADRHGSRCVPVESYD
ncbi:MAG: hypothetical protein A2Y78_00030 [Acidobacteria bacterium RBG_13_68_16]|nr:MAG: hypothetical protein A2Y78_00030 [Acidobacteria bacterium RBG_13_68_16]